jgi:diacylglycerol kinase (ATP)
MGCEELNKSLFILNPNAGVIPAKLIIPKLLEIRKNELSCFKSLSIDESGTHIKQSFDKYDIFIAAGGDGTVRTVAAELVGSQKIFGVLPMGSGNGFAKEFGFRTNITSLLSDIKKAESVKIDVIQLNDQVCLNVAGIGLDSFVAHSFDKAKIRGLWSYIWQTFKNFFLLKPVHITLQIEGEEPITEDLFVLSLANTRQFGNNAFIAPEAKPNDGIIDIVLIKPFPKIIAPLFVYRLFRGTMKNSKYIRYIKTEKPFTIRTNETRFHIDGEAVEFKGDVMVKIQKDVLNVLKTKHSKRPVQVSS